MKRSIIRKKSSKELSNLFKIFPLNLFFIFVFNLHFRNRPHPKNKLDVILRLEAITRWLSTLRSLKSWLNLDEGQLCMIQDELSDNADYIDALQDVLKNR